MKNIKTGMLVVFILLLACGDFALNVTTHKIKYSVSGNLTNIKIVYGIKNNKTKEVFVEKLPWSKSFEGKESDYYYIHLMSNSDGNATIVVRNDLITVALAKSDKAPIDFFVMGEI